ncbi:MAG TPA: Rpn family recombination-promoting nuclease/putative transposase [Candidatus Blautia merdigallinarum]|uniref:Rpn family recombination-promoting nuclease/putative transposase n=1 Tax=Candidatus Blautia merdigallinarum TaxID=2838495 RepID=A0A9D2SJZ8_9FIRM|nr:Rpn family recombination-promoting nuclease/putative transposase [Candidatus Blautia merdigallinarum]
MSRRKKGRMALSAYDAEIYEALQEPKIFADLFNGSLFDGQQLIREDMLEEENEKGLVKAQDNHGNPAIIYRVRDNSKKGYFSENRLKVILAVENQRSVHYGMPVRNMMYDAIAYTKEAKALERKNRKELSLKEGKEFLSGLKKEDRLSPLLTLVFYYGEDQDWDGPTSLHEMLQIPKDLESWKKYIPDYKINLVTSRTVKKENFHTGLREVFELLEVFSSREELEMLLREKEDHYKNLDGETSWLVEKFLDIPILKENQEKYRDERGKVNMCTAIRDMVKNGEKRGEERSAKLALLLAKKNRLEDLEKISKDKEYRDKLFQEFGI